MAKDKGRLDYMSQKKKWKAVGYKGSRDVELGRYDKREEAANRLQKYIRTGK